MNNGWESRLKSTVKVAPIISFTGHGNTGRIGGSDTPTSGFDPNGVAKILSDIAFKGGKIVLSVCGTHTLNNTFASNLSSELQKQIAGLGKVHIFWSTTKLDADVDPFATNTPNWMSTGN